MKLRFSTKDVGALNAALNVIQMQGSPRLFEQEGDYSYISNHLLLCPLGGPDGITPLQAECRCVANGAGVMAGTM